MKNAILLHGSGETPESCWLPAIKKFLENQGYDVWAPQLPGSETPDLKTQLPFVLENGEFTSDTILIAHSAGCALALSVLENIKISIRKAILVAGYARPLSEEHDHILQEVYDWNKIKNNVEKIIFINSDNDPWGCNDKEGEYMQKNLGGELIVNHEAHMGSKKFNQPYKEFPFLEKILTQ